MEEKKYQARFFVWLFYAVTTICLILTVAPSIVHLFAPNFEIYKVSINMDLVAWSYMAVATVYVGSNQLEHIMLSRKLPCGEGDFGDLGKIQKMIFGSVWLLLVSVCLDTFFNAEISTDAFFIATASMISLYISGVKAAKGVSDKFDNSSEHTHKHDPKYDIHESSLDEKDENNNDDKKEEKHHIELEKHHRGK